MAVRGAARLAAATAVAALIGLTGPGAGAQEDPSPSEPAAPAAPSIRDALTGTSTVVTGSAEGGFAGGDTLDVTLTLENHTAAPIELTVPRGALFETDDETEQTAVTVGPEVELASAVEPGVDPTITVEPGTQEVQLTGYCAQRLDSGPNDVVPMHWAGVAQEPLTTVLTNIAATDPDPTSAQHAIWWVTDVPVLPVPDEVASLLEGVDTEAFAANPKRVVPDERYTPAWGRDQALDPDDPFGDPAVDFGEPLGGDGAFQPDGGGDGGGPGMGLLLLGAVAASLVITVLVARSGKRATPAVARTNANAAGGGATPPGWHPDPQDPQQLRYWDGRAWTGDTRPF